MANRTKLLKLNPIPDSESDITLPMIYISLYSSSKNAGRLLDELYNDIISIRNCTIYYREDPELELDRTYEAILSNMKAFVLPLNRISTGEMCVDMQMWKFDIKFAKAHDIPIIPIMLEPNLEEKSAPLIGPVNILSKVYNLNANGTVETYKEKLKDSLDRIFDNDAKKEAIKKVFSAKLFFSYRQKDREDAIKLIKLIHETPLGEDLAIWYDEFLGVTSNYHKYILEELDSCKAVILMVTPTLLKRSARPDDYSKKKEWYNYVVTKEYPTAVKKHKKIIPIYVPLWYGDPLDEEEVEKLLPKISKYNPIRLDWNEPEEFKEEISERIRKDIHPKSKKSKERDYLLSEAYRYGFCVEENQQKADELLKKAVKKGHNDIKSLERLSQKELSAWYDDDTEYTLKLLPKLKEKYIKFPDSNNVSAYIELELAYSRFLSGKRGRQYREAWNHARTAYDIAVEYASITQSEKLKSQLASCYEQLASFSEGRNVDNLHERALELRSSIYIENPTAENLRAYIRTITELRPGMYPNDYHLALSESGILAKNPQTEDNKLIAKLMDGTKSKDIEKLMNHSLAYTRGSRTISSVVDSLYYFMKSNAIMDGGDEKAGQQEICRNIASILSEYPEIFDEYNFMQITEMLEMSIKNHHFTMETYKADYIKRLIRDGKQEDKKILENTKQAEEYNDTCNILHNCTVPTFNSDMLYILIDYWLMRRNLSQFHYLAGELQDDRLKDRYRYNAISMLKKESLEKDDPDSEPIHPRKLLEDSFAYMDKGDEAIEEKDYPKALEHYRNALKIQGDINLRTPVDIECLYRLSRIQYRQKKFENAQSYVDKCISYADTVYGKENYYRYSHLLWMKAGIIRELAYSEPETDGQLPTATDKLLPAALEAYKQIQKSYGYNSREAIEYRVTLAGDYSYMSELTGRQDYLDEAIEHASVASDYLTKLLADDNKQKLIQCYYTLATCEQKKGELKDAAEHFYICKDLMLETSIHPESAMTKDIVTPKDIDSMIAQCHAEDNKGKGKKKNNKTGKKQTEEPQSAEESKTDTNQETVSDSPYSQLLNEYNKAREMLYNTDNFKKASQKMMDYCKENNQYELLLDYQKKHISFLASKQKKDLVSIMDTLEEECSLEMYLGMYRDALEHCRQAYRIYRECDTPKSKLSAITSAMAECKAHLENQEKPEGNRAR